MSRKGKALMTAVVAIVGIWLLAWGGYWVAKKAKMTAERVLQFARSINLAKLSGKERADALKRLEDKINQMSLEERRKWRRSQESKDLFNEMSDAEKGQFIEATMPTGFKQMLNAFEDMPPDKRKRELDSAMKRLKESAEAGQTNSLAANGNTNTPPPLSPELEKKAMTIGLKTFYSESSAQTKVELSPLLEELQHQMEGGVRPFR